MTRREEQDRSLRDLIDIIHFTESVSAKIHGLVDESEIYGAVMEEFARSRRYSASIVLLAQNGSQLRVAYTSISDRKRRAGERISGRRLKAFQFDLTRSSAYRKVIEEEKTLQVDVRDIISELFPQPLATLIARATGYDKKSSILTPLKLHHKVIGVFAMSSTELSQYLMPSVKTLGEHISTALELAAERAWHHKAEENLLRLSSAVRMSTDGIVVTGLDGRITDVNQAIMSMYGTDDRNDLIGKNSFDFIVSEDRERAREGMKEAFEKGYVKNREYQIMSKTRTTVPIELNACLIKDAGGRPTGFVSICRDISERKHAEKELRENEERFKRLFESSPNPVALVDLDLNVLDCNQAALETFGYSAKGELLGRNARELLEPQERERLSESVRSTLELGTVRGVDFNILTEDGRRLAVEISGSVMRDSSGRPASFIAVFRDVSERKRSEKALRESEQRYRNLVENMPAVIYSLDIAGRIVSVNKAAKTLFGFEPDELIGKNITEFVPDAALSEVAARHREVLAGHKVATETTMIDRHGRSHDVDFSAVPVTQDGEVVGSQGVVRDITHRKRAEDELRRSREQLRDLSAHLQSVREEERVEVARRIHDELGQTCTALKMDLAWLKSKLPKSQKPLRKKADSMLSLTDSAIKAVKVISTELRPTLLDDLGLVAAIEWAAGQFRERTGIECTISAQPEEMTVEKGLSVTLFRVFQEALTNVARHADATEVKTTLRERDGLLELKVKDNGKGITPEQVTDPKAYGLVGMRERLLSWGGELTIQGGKTKGTTLTASVPLSTQGENHDQNTHR